MKRICQIGKGMVKAIFIGAVLLWIVITDVVGILVDLISRG